ncbi:pectate lyase superfamily protein domain-containing protein [Penicillium desertorum]|uniref:Pectate lyase superfamily protein domain-containing protein n=1 Tax=Penicillium desertorum TaxID=1303715 RepID=A0A9W9WPF1_9EURO|nr:pectate lyase superfamily protein domain-containing protein [Penicillium desertorum]
MAQIGRWFDVTEYGIDRTKRTTHPDGIKRAIDAAKSAGGGNVWFPEGDYFLGDAGVELDCGNITLAGVGRSSTVHVTNWTSIPFPIDKPDTTIRDLSIVHDRDNVSEPFTPTEYPETIKVVGSRAKNVLLTNLHLECPTIGIRALEVGDSLTISRITGQPLKTGIEIEKARGNVNVNGVAFGPLWNNTTPVLNFQYDGLVAVKSIGNTAQSPIQFSNIVATHCKAGFLFTGKGDPNQIDPKLKVNAASNTSCVTGIVIEGSPKALDVKNYMFYGLEGASSECAIHAYDDFGFLKVGQMTSLRSGANAIRIDRSHHDVLLDGLWLQNWDQSGKRFPAIESTSGTKVKVSKPNFYHTPGSTAHPDRPQISATGVVFE